MRSGADRERGTSLHELLAWMTLVGILAAAVAPDLHRWTRARTLEAAAERIALAFVAMRAAAVAEGRAHALAFRVERGALSWQRVVDGDGDGVRSADIASGVDSLRDAPTTLQPDHPGVLPGLAPRMRGPGGAVAPASGVAFGRAGLLVAAPDGTASSGTIYLHNGAGDAVAVRVYGPTARLSVWARRAAVGSWSRLW